MLIVMTMKEKPPLYSEGSFKCFITSPSSSEGSFQKNKIKQLH